MTNSIQTRTPVGAAAIVLAALSMPIAVHAAGVPESLAKLRGSSASNAGDAMTRAGYKPSGEKESWSRKDSFWWNAGNRQCLRLTSRFGFVSGVATVAAADCASIPASGADVPGKPGVLTASDLLGLSRSAGERRLADAGFNSQGIDESKAEGLYGQWFNQSTGQCIAAQIVGNRFEHADDLPTSRCR